MYLYTLSNDLLYRNRLSLSISLKHVKFSIQINSTTMFNLYTRDVDNHVLICFVYFFFVACKE